MFVWALSLLKPRDSAAADFVKGVKQMIKTIKLIIKKPVINPSIPEPMTSRILGNEIVNWAIKSVHAIAWRTAKTTTAIPMTTKMLLYAESAAAGRISMINGLVYKAR